MGLWYSVYSSQCALLYVLRHNGFHVCWHPNQILNSFHSCPCVGFDVHASVAIHQSNHSVCIMCVCVCMCECVCVRLSACIISAHVFVCMCAHVCTRVCVCVCVYVCLCAFVCWFCVCVSAYVAVVFVQTLCCSESDSEEKDGMLWQFLSAAAPA